MGLQKYENSLLSFMIAFRALTGGIKLISLNLLLRKSELDPSKVLLIFDLMPHASCAK